MNDRPPLDPNPSGEELLALLRDYLFLELHSDYQQVAFFDATCLLEDSPEDCWRLIELAAQMDLTTDQAAYFAAGTVEDILGLHGEAFIDRLEIAARAQPGIRAFVAGIWRGRMSDAVWSRVRALREELDIQPL